MQRDVFGNLTEWGDVLDTLQSLRQEAVLDEHQTGLARLVRHRGNWRLRQAALECSLDISCASDVLIADTLHTLVDTETPLRLRVMAADALGHLVPRYSPNGSIPFDPDRVTEVMQQVVSRPQPPVLEQAVSRALGVCRSGRKDPAGMACAGSPITGR